MHLFDWKVVKKQQQHAFIKEINAVKRTKRQKEISSFSPLNIPRLIIKLNKLKKKICNTQKPNNNN